MKKITLALLLLCIIVPSTNVYARMGSCDRSLYFGLGIFSTLCCRNAYYYHYGYCGDECLCSRCYHYHSDLDYCSKFYCFGTHCCHCRYCRSKSQKAFAKQVKELANTKRRQISGVKILNARFYKEYTTDTLPKISGVKVLNARFYKEYTTDTLPISMAEITIENKSDHSIKTIFFNGKLTTHKTGQVLINDAFTYDIDGALAPKETNTYNIPLNSYGKWAKARPPDLAKFDVVVTGVEI